MVRITAPASMSPREHRWAPVLGPVPRRCCKAEKSSLPLGSTVFHRVAVQRPGRPESACAANSAAIAADYGCVSEYQVFRVSGKDAGPKLETIVSSSSWADTGIAAQIAGRNPTPSRAR